VAQVRVAVAALDLGSDHAKARVADARDALSSSGLKKLGQPVPESNLVSEVKRGCPQQTQT
jgi:hypothetical protein